MLAIKDKATNSFCSKHKVTNLKIQQMTIFDNHNPNS